ncbi:SlyX family protein [Methylobacterium isbiliense]|jgi:SlyX protein|uniref:Protein SlyX homolog n=1 Tax=Methylobacterium isbiliense TaxID=315478 RepID=A0ABQ4SIZ4_9HYPH|nr:SlyX family protein [Methylobacterium isbiliense]MDN3624101.1 SlyX family protein [Methylobacterium isbiliense]GJE01853.1 Protein SlyX [Methylobacterium isbiliense]
MPDDPSPPAPRLDEVEIRLTHQERTIEDLSRTVAEQWARIDLLTRQVAGLSERLREMVERPVSAAPEPPPPHY